MKNTTLSLAIGAAVVAALASCQSAVSISCDEALSAKKLEIQIDVEGRMTEVEYHISPTDVPAAVQEAMDRLHPGGAFTDAEREYHGGKVYFELNRMVGGLEVEAMFLPDGTLHSEEVEILRTNVPESVRIAIRDGYPEGRVTKYEEIRDGNRELVEYHVKVRQGGIAYKVLVSPEGEHIGTFREIESEIEVPVD